MRTFLITMNNGDQRTMYLIDMNSSAEEEIKKWGDADQVAEINEVFA